MDNDRSARAAGDARDEPVVGAAPLDAPSPHDAPGTEFPERHEPEYAPGSETYDPRLDEPSEAPSETPSRDDPDANRPEPDPEVKDNDLLPERDFSTDEAGKLR